MRNAKFGAATQTGPDYPDGVQSPLNQVAVRQSMNKLTGEVAPSRGLAGPLTGLNVDQEAPIGTANQTFALLSSTTSSVANITQSVGSLQAVRLSNAASQRYFQAVLEKSFEPEKPVSSGNKSADEILASLSGGSISDLSTMMSVASLGVTTSKQLIEGINEGTLGYSTPTSSVESNRLGPTGYSRERIAK
jgi:hypothetical protein